MSSESDWPQRQWKHIWAGKGKSFLTGIHLSSASMWNLPEPSFNLHLTHTLMCQAPLIRPLPLAVVTTPINRSLFLEQTPFIWQEGPPSRLTSEGPQVSFQSSSQGNFICTISGVSLPQQRPAAAGNLILPLRHTCRQLQVINSGRLKISTFTVLIGLYMTDYCSPRTPYQNHNHKQSTWWDEGN